MAVLPEFLSASAQLSPNMNGQRNVGSGQLTRKQAAAVQKAKGQAAKAAMRNMFAAQNAEQYKAPPRRSPQRPAPRQRVPRALVPYAFNGFDKRHMPVDEVTAPYAVTNFTNVMEFGTFTDKDQVIVVCPRQYAPQDKYPASWYTDYIAMRYDGAEVISNSMAFLSFLRCPIAGHPDITTEEQHMSTRARLHNLSVRLECLGTNTGLYPPGSAYIGTVPMLENGDWSTGGEKSLTATNAWAMDAITVGYLRSVPAASLVEKPVHVDSAIAETVAYKAWRDFAIPATTVAPGGLSFSTALEPIVIFVPRCGEGTTTVQYRIVVGQQWCSRHPNDVMLRATQRQHTASTPDAWHKAVSAVKDIGPRLVERAAEGAVGVLLAAGQNGGAMAAMAA